MSDAIQIEVLYSDECKTLLARGHVEKAAFVAACEEWNGGPLDGWGKVKHRWCRNIPDSSGEYRFLMHPAKPGARGAYKATTVCDDAAYDTEYDDA